MYRWYQADLHVHTALSPCARREMSPPAIVDSALTAGLDIIAITDHNSIGNIRAVQCAASGTHLTVLPGIEVQTSEEVHLICLFPALENAEAAHAKIQQNLPSCTNRPDYFGEQLLFDYRGNIIGIEQTLLLNSCLLSINEIMKIVNEADGIAIPAHIDRKAYSILEVLGFIPPNLFPALEISGNCFSSKITKQYFSYGYPLIVSSDAHSLSEIGVVKSKFYLSAPSLSALIEYLQK